MPQDQSPLSADERAELEQLRAEKRARANAEARAGVDVREAERIVAARKRGRELMEPGEDLSMPLGQKIVLGGLALVVLVIILLFVFMPR